MMSWQGDTYLLSRLANLSAGICCRYAWTYVETFQGVKKGDRVWQLAFGSGFKCCSAVWVALKNNAEKHDAWMDVESYS